MSIDTHELDEGSISVSIDIHQRDERTLPLSIIIHQSFGGTLSEFKPQMGHI